MGTPATPSAPLSKPMHSTAPRDRTRKLAGAYAFDFSCAARQLAGDWPNSETNQRVKELGKP
jgi:hypothetical protein